MRLLCLLLFTCMGCVSTFNAKALHFSSIVIDTHDDTTQRLLNDKFDLADRHADGSIDIPRMREGGLSAIFFSIYIDGSITGPIAVQKALNQINLVRGQVKTHPRDLALATTADEVVAAHKAGKIAALLGVEGGHMINNDVEVLRNFADLGVRYMTLTHRINTDWADSSTDKPVHNGLTDFGKEVVGEMNRLGVMVDISHVSDKTFYDALAASKAPIIASHSSCRAISKAPRNMSDDMIRALAKNGGVIQINYHVGFLSQEFTDAEAAHPEIRKKADAESERKCGTDEACSILVTNQMIHDAQDSHQLPKVDWTKIIDHIDHAVKIAGIEHVGLGSDFDGAIMPIGMEDATKLPLITEALLQRGYSPGDIRKILGENTLRLMRDVERISRELNAEEKRSR